ncbi:hypothetical protein Agabi119p4_6739 [Agaricus bisporus var. burnettii]|uniref:Uncharacterized protein n=1 Tax=Agaricus bisporus var. burnettii TaxID=192524 RepID=A0A8H7C9X4_AGABI|nr:hypothetical protein Agabi119p4_6739 [Agaricus bisporus var. burnettii]
MEDVDSSFSLTHSTSEIEYLKTEILNLESWRRSMFVWNEASVLELVEKVEQSNDIRSWPFNRLQLTRSAGSPRPIEPTVRQSPTQDHLSYAGAIIERLRLERDEERMEHASTREALQSRIDALEARLARRETELEYYTTHAAAERNQVEVDSDPEAMTNEDIIMMLDTTAARNRSLEVEIKSLFKRLHEARSLPNSTEAASPPLPPGLETPTRPLLDVPEAIRGVVQEDDDTSSIIAGLDTELAELTVQIDGFRLERERLSRMVDARRVDRETHHPSNGNRSDRSVGSSPEETIQDRLEVVEEECMRLGQELTSVETTLLAEVQELQRRVEELSAITPRTPQFADETEGALMLDDGDVDRLLDVLDGEESMEDDHDEIENVVCLGCGCGDDPLDQNCQKKQNRGRSLGR